MSEEVAERSPLEEMICEAIYTAIKDWLDEEGLAEQMCGAAREGTIEALEGAVPFWSRKRRRTNSLSTMRGKSNGVT